jgi:hypothetical protein
MALDMARERRRFLIDMALRRARPGTGSSMEFYRRRDWSALRVDLSEIKTPFAIVGAVATRLYMPERVTHDIDLFVPHAVETTLTVELEQLGFTKQGNLTFGRSTWVNDPGERLDLIASHEPWANDAVATAVTSPDGLPVVRLPYLVLLKFKASRSLDVGDLSRMLGLASEAALAEVRTVVQRFQPEDLYDLESLITLGELVFGSDGEGRPQGS